ncbi:MAG: hypothetical protein GF335_04860 [Candidatus Moranbacteria bacterium]|nr:hypothetical protein [Candidatus Moranbacteria bacterium]
MKPTKEEHKAIDKLRQITDLGLASSLLSYGIELWALDDSNSNRVVFNFKWNDQIDELIERYWSGSLQVDARTMHENERMLKTRIRSVK